VNFDILARGLKMDPTTREIILGEFYSPIGVMRKHLPVFIANKLVKAHGGKLEIDISAEKNKTIFTVQMPRVRPAHLKGKEDNADLAYLAHEWN
jgi:hypothetical protein